MLCNPTSTPKPTTNQIGHFATTDKLTFRSTFLAVRLHGYVRVQVIQSTVSFLTPLMSTLVHALDLFVATSRAFVLLRTRDRNEGIYLRKWMRTLTRLSATSTPPVKINVPGPDAVDQL